MTTIGSIGIGLLILIIIWVLALLVFVVGIKLQSNIAWIAIGSATLITIILLIVPTEKHNNKASVDRETEEKDYILVYKQLFFTFLGTSVIIGFLAFFILHCIEPIRAKPIKNFS